MGLHPPQTVGPRAAAPTSEAQVLRVHLDHKLAIHISEDTAVHPIVDESEGAATVRVCSISHGYGTDLSTTHTPYP